MSKIDADMKHLETILKEFREAVVACDRNARILLYNSAASQLFHNYEAMGLGQSLFRVCAQAPVEHTLKMLQGHSGNREFRDLHDPDSRFVCATVDGSMLLRCNISMISAGKEHEQIFVVTFEDITKKVNEMGRQGYLLEKMIKDLRAPITNLNSAVENLKQYPEMLPELKSDFEDIILRESTELTRRFEDIVEESNKFTNIQWPLFDVYSADLIGCVARRFTEKDGVTVTMTGVPLWLHADSFSLMLVLDQFVRFVRDFCKVTEVDIEVLLGDRRIYIDVVWKGETVPQSAIESELLKILPDTGEDMTLNDVLIRHDSEIWSQSHRRKGYSLLRIPVPDSPRQWELPPQPVSDRPEFYDFTLAEDSVELGELAAMPLSSLNYVVFETETTGLRPSEGDEILSIAAVRIVNRRILSGERFERLIRPERPIPISSLPFIETTEEMVHGEPPVEVVLPQFRSFVADAVMVGHNPTIDMQFFRLQEEKSGVVFDNSVLDTLLMALVIDKERTKYTLADICGWLDIEMMGSGTIMDDCFQTAQIFLGLLDLLEKKGIVTLGRLVDVCRRVAEEKRQHST